MSGKKEKKDKKDKKEKKEKKEKKIKKEKKDGKSSSSSSSSSSDSGEEFHQHGGAPGYEQPGAFSPEPAVPAVDGDGERVATASGPGGNVNADVNIPQSGSTAQYPPGYSEHGIIKH